MQAGQVQGKVMGKAYADSLERTGRYCLWTYRRAAPPTAPTGRHQKGNEILRGQHRPGSAIHFLRPGGVGGSVTFRNWASPFRRHRSLQTAWIGGRCWTCGRESRYICGTPAWPCTALPQAPWPTRPPVPSQGHLPLPFQFEPGPSGPPCNMRCPHSTPEFIFPLALTGNSEKSPHRPQTKSRHLSCSPQSACSAAPTLPSRAVTEGLQEGPSPAASAHPGPHDTGHACGPNPQPSDRSQRAWPHCPLGVRLGVHGGLRNRSWGSLFMGLTGRARWGASETPLMSSGRLSPREGYSLT